MTRRTVLSFPHCAKAFRSSVKTHQKTLNAAREGTKELLKELRD
jgi:hypothetical protein